MHQPSFRFEDVLSEAFEAPTRYPYWKLYSPTNQVLAECVGAVRVGAPRGRSRVDARGESPEGEGEVQIELGEEGGARVDPDVSRTYLSRVLERLEPGKYTLVCWANPQGHRNARGIPFVKPAQFAPGPAGLGAAGGVSSDALAPLLDRITALQEQNQQLVQQQAERDRKAETTALREQLKALNERLNSSDRWIEPIGRLLLARFVPQASALLPPSPAPVAGVGQDAPAEQGKIEVQLSPEQINELEGVVASLLQRGGPQAFEQLKALNRLDDASLRVVLSTPLA